ncbi:progesterone-induced-blocking factor 1 [Octopus bimaculoides]|uniref:Progesterone-induced-blocking factor 1 n=1 Tax=Octopus bimaculoides TaxID=37653 RepID=A0A0L8GSJ8_OCTBM|nr:progesterone-induced-blocking factor 1 [Octopus bimaculoides]|eukprot:XP_014778353.1 PREDICTED: progesterone-induced-blocking factor 1-like [Octopus bimaculoides]
MMDMEFSQIFRDQESDEISLETSVPTDTFSPEREHVNRRSSRRIKDTVSNAAGRNILEKKQLLHDLQLHKIESSQKGIAIDNLKIQHMQRTEELEEKLNEALYQKQILQTRLESEIRIQQEEFKRYQDSMKKELEDVVKKQHQLESSNAILQDKACDVKNSLLNLDLSEQEYYELRSQKEEDWSLREYVSIKLYEKNFPLQNEVKTLKSETISSEREIKTLTNKLSDLQKRLDGERIAHGELRIKYQKMSLQLSENQTKIKTDLYKINNFDHIKSDRDNLQHDQTELQRHNLVLDASLANVQKERDDLNRQLGCCKQEISLLQQDKTYLSRQVNELTNRCTLIGEKVQETNLQLEDAKKSREEMYEKYISSRDHYKSDYETRLKEELAKIQSKTNMEIEKLRTSTKEMYDRENRNLREARDFAVMEKDKFELKCQEIQDKYDQLMNEFRTLQTSGDGRLLDLQSEVKLKSFEAERGNLVFEETCKNLKQCQLDLEKMEAKYDVLLKEYYAMENMKEKTITELNSELVSKNIRLDSYEKLEKELDEVVLQAAELTDQENAEKVLFAYGYGANVPTNAKRRLKQSIDLARRVLNLERVNTSLQHDLEAEKKCVQQITEELKSSKDLIHASQQPQSYLVETLKNRDNMLKTQKAELDNALKQNEILKTEQNRLLATQNQLSQDLDRLLHHQAEISLMKQVLMKISSGKSGGIETLIESGISFTQA